MPKGLTIEIVAETTATLQKLAEYQNTTVEKIAQDALRDWASTVGTARCEFLHETCA